MAAIGVAAVVLSGGALLPAVVGATKVIGVCVDVAVTYQVTKNVIKTVSSGGGKNEIKKNAFNNVNDAAANGVLVGGEIVSAMGVGEYYLEQYADKGFSFFNKHVQGMYNTPSKRVEQYYLSIS